MIVSFGQEQNVNLWKCCTSDTVLGIGQEHARIHLWSEPHVSRCQVQLQFQADARGDPSEAEVVDRKGKTAQVKGEKNLLEALRSVIEDVEGRREIGSCGTCKVGLLRGRVEHRDSGLSSEEKATAMLSCVSCGVGEHSSVESWFCSMAGSKKGG